MKRFPNEFADLLTRKGQKILRGGSAEIAEEFARRSTPFVLLGGVIHAERAAACQRLLDRAMYERLRPVKAPIPPETITGMKENYREALPKTMRFKTAYLASRSSMSYRSAKEIGLVQMMHSESFCLFAEAVTGLKLDHDNAVQCILYEHGDHAGPHNDHHPENDNAKDGFVDVHITFSNRDVASQYLVCEQQGYLSDMYSVTRSGAISVYRLPFWHYTTPLMARPNKERRARRWLLLGSFDIDPGE